MGLRPVDPAKLREIEADAREVGGFIDNAIPEGFGFALLIFGFGERSELTYLSNAERETMIDALEEFLVVVKARQDVPPGQPVKDTRPS